MIRDIDVSPIAQEDIRKIARWLRKRSPMGADSWYRAFMAAATKVAADAERFSLVDESPKLRRPVRHAIFKTRRGRRYRIIFDFTATVVHILRVRRPGQRPLQRRDLPDS